MKRICTVAVIALGFGLAGAVPAAASATAASGASTMASSPRTLARANVWWTAGWYGSEAICRSTGDWWVRNGAKTYACEYDSSYPNPAYPWRLRVLD
jgi:hypothetical protein